MAAVSDTDEIDRTGLLRIGELARRAGVARGTIQHYLREGLLPRPVKTHRNMAYYEPACVDRIRLIKELQSNSYMPLSEIRELLGDGSADNTLVHAIVHAQDAMLKAISPAARSVALTTKQAAKQLGLRLGLIENLVERGLVSLRDDDGKKVITGADLEVLAAVSKLKELGFTERKGFKAEDLAIYKTAMDQLLQQEVKTFMRVVSGRQSAEQAGQLARDAVEGATLLLLALRRKSISDMLSFAGAELVKPKKRSKKR